MRIRAPWGYLLVVTRASGAQAATPAFLPFLCWKVRRHTRLDEQAQDDQEGPMFTTSIPRRSWRQSHELHRTPTAWPVPVPGSTFYAVQRHAGSRTTPCWTPLQHMRMIGGNRSVAEGSHAVACLCLTALGA